MTNLSSQSIKSTRRTGGRREVANLPKVLNGPQGNEASETAASVETSSKSRN